MEASVLENVFVGYSSVSAANTVEKAKVTAPNSHIPAPVWDEDDLVRKAQARESRAFEQLYEVYVRRIYALCLRMVSDHQRAEELTQNAFVRAWEKIESFEFKSAFGTWLHRLSVNEVLMYLRTERRLESRVTSADDLYEFEAGTRQAMPETKMDLERAIAELPRGAKEILILHDVQGYRYREIAELTGVSEGTVKSQLSRARRLVREALEK
jgi:RNA polymerase sigma-70 factor (ECF subfamily)